MRVYIMSVYCSLNGKQKPSKWYSHLLIGTRDHTGQITKATLFAIALIIPRPIITNCRNCAPDDIFHVASNLPAYAGKITLK